MRHFKRIGPTIDVGPFLDEIRSVDGAWDNSTTRQEKIAVQREAMAIPLRGLRKSAIGDRKRRDVHESRWTSGADAYPLACAFLRDTADQLDSLLSRAKIVRLMPGRRVWVMVAAAVVGSVVYRIAVQFALDIDGLGLQASDLNLVTAVLVGAALILPGLGRGRLRVRT